MSFNRCSNCGNSMPTNDTYSCSNCGAHLCSYCLSGARGRCMHCSTKIKDTLGDFL
ncbi:MAG: hypothetical protein FWG51_01590 [Firmicutes bacterium]|nr:hypothetical protein [Bacillota bacterium]